MATAALVLGCGLGPGCGSSNVVLRSNHYHVAVPADWQVAAEADGPGRPTVLRVPAGGDGTGDLELRLYAWVDSSGAGDPVGAAVRRLAGGKEGAWRAAAAVDESRCAERARSFVVFGEPRPAAHLRSAADEYFIVTAAEANGSLVALVGQVTDRRPFCENVETIEASIARLGKVLVASGDFSRDRPRPVTLMAPGGVGPVTELPAADPLPDP